MGRKPTQKEKVAAVLQEQITEAMRKKTANAQNHTHPQTKQVVMKNIKPKPPVNAKLKLFNQIIQMLIFMIDRLSQNVNQIGPIR